MNIKKIFLFSAMIGIALSLNVSASELNYIVGSNRYETASLIAEKMSYNNAILVNGTALVDGLSASGLSGTINAPILLTETNYIPSSTINALKNVNNVYIVGGEGVVSKGIEEELKKQGKTVIRLGGTSRYETSLKVANEIEKHKTITEVYYVNGEVGEADAMSIAPVAAQNSNPVILTNGKFTSYKKEATGFIIGGMGVMSKDLDYLGERLGGSSRFETNKKVVSRFFNNIDEVYLSKGWELIDALTSSALKKPVILVDKNTDKSIIAGANSITAIGGIDKLTMARVNSYIYGDKVVFYTQHQDDETLFAGSAIVDAIKSVGQENVYVVLFTKGNKSDVFNQERYKKLSDDERAELRNNEFDAAVQKLGIARENIIKLNQNEYSINYKELSSLIEGFESEFSSVTHITHSYKYDVHTEHMQTGQVIYDLYNEGKIQDARFFAGSNEGVKIPLDYLIQSVSDTEDERSKVMEACQEYKLDNKDMVREGIGYKSVSWMFNNLKNDIKATNYLHRPGA